MVKKFIVLDVEGSSTARPYNIGYIVADKHGNIYEKRSFAIPNFIFENLKKCIGCKDMTYDNIQEILESYGQSQKYAYVSPNEFQSILLNDISKYKVSKIWGYHVSFDKSALKRGFAEVFSIIDNLVDFCDIEQAILFTKLLTKKYITFCRKHNYLTKKGNIQTKAEIVYRYLNNDNDFIEEHTGLSDVLIEYEILLKAMQTKKKIVKDGCCPWQIVKKFCNEKDY